MQKRGQESLCGGRPITSSVGVGHASRTNEEATMTDRAPLPHDFLPKVASFTVQSRDVTQDEQMSEAEVYNGFGMSGENISPQLSWHGFPAETKGFAVTCVDPDDPTRLGVWDCGVFGVLGAG